MRINLPARVIVIFISFIMLLLIAGFCLLFLLTSGASYDINKLNPQKIQSIKIYDKGILGYDSVFINDPEKVKALSRLMVSSPKISLNDFNIKTTQGSFGVELQLKDSVIYCELLKISPSKGILASGSNYYRNDSLLNIAIENVKQKSPRDTLR